MKNKLLLSFALLFVSMLTYGQTITHKTVASAGGSYSGANFSASFTMGQTFNATLSASGQMATQGFQQPVFTYYRDYDNDGFGNKLVSLIDFVAPTGYVLDSTDCNDSLYSNRTQQSRTSNQTVSVCNGALPYLWNGQQLNTAGNYSINLTAVDGCDSVANLNLSINQATSHVTYRNLCRRDSTLWNGAYYSKTIIDTVMLSNAYGCDSMDILNLNVYPLYYNVVTRYFCKGSSFVYNGQTISTVGTYYYHFTSATGCDSTVRLRALNYPASTSKVSVPLCTGSSVTYGGSIFTAPGIYLVHLTNYLGCDSAVTLTLVKRTKTYSKQTIYRCANDSVQYNGLFYKNNGNYTVNLTNRFGCDSVVTLTVLSRPVTYSIVTKYFCIGDSLLYDGAYYKQPGTYIVRLRNYRGCDSVVSLRALNYPNKVAYVSRGICQGSSLTYGGQSYTQAGIYAIHSKSYQGCDSVTQLTVFKLPTSYSNVTIYRCQGQTISYNGQSYTANGAHTVFLTNRYGCDSVISLLVLTAPKVYSTLTHYMCQGDSLLYHGRTYKATGTYYVNLQSYRGCDSTVRLRVLYNNSASLTTVILCPGQTFLWNGTTYTSFMSGTFQSRFVNYRGCDSIAVLKVYKGSCKELGTPTATTVTIATDEVAAEEMDNTTAIGMNPELSIFPNPNTGNFMLQNNCLSCKQMHVEVFTMEGKLMYVADADNTSGKININLSVSAGMYWVKLSNKEGTYSEVKSFVVE